MTQSIAYTYSNWVNRPVLMVSVGSDRFYKDKCNVNESFNSKFLSIINGNTVNHGDLINYTYKINDLLYYYQAHSNPAASKAQHELDLKLFLERAIREFGMVIVDLDDQVNAFEKFLDIADMCFIVVPPDNTVMRNTKEAVTEVLEEYREQGGLAVRTKMMYIVNKLDGGVSKSIAARTLAAPPKDVFAIDYDPRFIKESNRNALTAFLSSVIIESRSPKDKVIEVPFKRIYDSIRNI